VEHLEASCILKQREGKLGIESTYQCDKNDAPQVSVTALHSNDVGLTQGVRYRASAWPHPRECEAAPEEGHSYTGRTMDNNICSERVLTRPTTQFNRKRDGVAMPIMSFSIMYCH